MNYITYARVTRIEERYQRTYIHGTGIGPDAKFEDRPLGWFISIEGSYEVLNLGTETPTIAEGDTVKITIEKVQHAHLIPASK